MMIYSNGSSNKTVSRGKPPLFITRHIAVRPLTRFTVRLNRTCSETVQYHRDKTIHPGTFWFKFKKSEQGHRQELEIYSPPL